MSYTQIAADTPLDQPDVDQATPAPLDAMDAGDEYAADFAEFAGTRSDDEPIQNNDSVAVSLGHKLQGEFAKRKTERQEIERRWLRDLRQYNGVYEPEFEAFLKERKSSCKVFVPMTRRVCNIVEARLGDLLFPTDDRNFAVASSPIPDLASASAGLAKAAPGAQTLIAGQPVPVVDVVTAIRDVIDESKVKAANMQRLIDDQFAECDYPTQARRAIHDAIKLGTGVIKGPYVLSKTKKRWVMTGGAATLTVDTTIKPSIKHVDPWNFYPDLSVALMENSDVFERHPMTKLDLMNLSLQPGFSKDAIMRAVKAGATYRVDSNIDATRESVGTVGVEDSKFNVIEYNGPIDAEDLTECGCDLGESDDVVFNAIVWFSEHSGDVLKAVLSPMSTNVGLYSAFNWQPDAACVFGYGLAHEIADLQDTGNSAFRAAQDNLALCVGPQTVVNSKKITPMNGSWAMEPNKMWDLMDASVPVSSVFGFYQIDMRLQEIMAMFNLSKQLIDEIGGPSLAMQGSDAPNFTQTATGASIQYNAANIWMRRAVKLWDDQVTVPRVRAFVDWNMEHSTDESVKGDHNVLARGASALINAEGQVQRLQLLQQASAAANIPLRKKISQLRQMALAMRLDPDEHLPNDEEISAMEQAEQQAPPPIDPETTRLQLREKELQDNAEERQFRRETLNENNKMRLAEIASREGITTRQAEMKYELELTKIDRQNAAAQLKLDRQTQMFNAELVTKARQGSGI